MTHSAKLRNAKIRFGLMSLVQIHHIIPLEHKNHHVLQHCQFDINDDFNLLLMPTMKGSRMLNINEKRLIHDGGHMQYNRFVKTKLDEIAVIENKHYELGQLCSYLKDNLRRNDDDMPWS